MEIRQNSHREAKIFYGVGPWGELFEIRKKRKVVKLSLESRNSSRSSPWGYYPAEVLILFFCQGTVLEIISRNTVGGYSEGFFVKLHQGFPYRSTTGMLFQVFTRISGKWGSSVGFKPKVPLMFYIVQDAYVRHIARNDGLIVPVFL